MKMASADIMRSIDKCCIENLKIPGIVLMENAAISVIKNIDIKNYNSFVIVCGKGNNGGDGFAVARHLLLKGKKIDVFLIGSDEGMSGDCRINYEILKNLGIKISKINNVEDVIDLRERITECDMTVDAIFGTGLTRKVEGIYDMVISVMNENSSYILSVDVPSGFQSDTGRILGNCVKAHITISFQLYKKGFVNYGTDKLTGRIIIEDIGIPEAAINKFHNNEFILDRAMIKENFLVRDKYSYKGDYGRVLIIAGTKGYSGAAYISTQSAVRSGAGLVTLCCHRDIADVLSSKLVEAMTINFGDTTTLEGDSKLKNHIEKSNAIAIGPGMGNNDTTLQLLKLVIENSECPVVIDADGINVLQTNIELLKYKKNKIVLTPHFGEMSRISGLSIEEIKDNRVEVAKQFALNHDVIVLLKGYNTVITDGKTTVINSTGNSSMASGGMGDCLTGIITSLIGQGYEPMTAACIGAYIHGYCGERLSEKMFCVNASHIIEEIPCVIKELQQN